jgi:dephospho-CoA kinase
MKVVALTGSIGMGKSTTTAMFADLGIPVWDADAAVHRIYSRGGAGVAPVSAAFPGALTADQSIDRAILATLVLGKPDALKHLESLVHPLVGQDRATFLNAARNAGAKIALVDVPLLFETGGDASVDATIVVSCAPETQRARVLARPGMSLEKFEAILARQMPDADKRARADFVVTTDTGLDDTREQVGKIYESLLGESAVRKDKS